MVTARSTTNAGAAVSSRRVADYLLSWDRMGFRLLVFGGMALTWVLLGLLSGGPWRPIVLAEVGGLLPFVFLAPLIQAIAQRIKRSRPSVSRYLASHLLGMALIAVPYWVMVRVIQFTWRCFEAGWHLQWAALMPTPRNMVSAFLSVPVVYFVILLGAEASEHAQARQEEEAQAGHLARQLTDARLALLQRQVHPHFLFNALQAISTLLHRAPATADRLLVHLSDLLRAMLENASEQTLSLRTELDLTRKYLEIEQARFEDRLRVDWYVDEELLDLQVPSLVVLPLVENAIRHGLSPKMGPGCLTIRAWTEFSSLFVAVADDGLGATLPLQLGLGVGNTRERLDVLYGDRAALHIDTASQRGFRATLQIPRSDGHR
jgi:two-component system, LytTR family, sensor kinase